MTNVNEKITNFAIFLDVLEVNYCLKLTCQIAGNGICEVIVFKIFLPTCLRQCCLGSAFGASTYDTARF